MSSAAALCRVIERAGAAIGYGHAVAVGLWAGPPLATVPPGTWELELWLGDTQDPEEGLAAAAEALALLSDEVFTTTLAIACCGLVPITNETAARAHERARLRWRRIWHDPRLGPTWVMLRERPP
jgi:aminoglycoside 6'-N-acetyltransferase